MAENLILDPILAHLAEVWAQNFFGELYLYK